MIAFRSKGTARSVLCMVFAFIIAGGPLLFRPAVAAAGDDEKPNYGRTPGEYVPYSRFSRPYKRLFLDPSEYRGYGRSIPEPEAVESVKIGFLGPVEDTVSVATGGSSHELPLGLMMLKGAQLAVALANERNGYRGEGIPYELVVRNDNGLWGASGEEVIRFAYEDKVWAVLGTIDGANSHIAIRAALKLELPVMSCGDTDPTFTETAIPWAFRCIVDDRQMGYMLADFVFKKLGLTRVAALRANNRYARIGIGEVRDAAVRMGYPFIAELNYEVGDRDFGAQLTRLKKLDPEAVITFGNMIESAHILKQMRAMGMDQWLLGSDRMVSPELFTIAGAEVGRVAAGYPYDPLSDDPLHAAFLQEFEARFGMKPEAYAAHAFDGMNILIRAIEKAGLNRAKIRDELAEMKGYRGATGVMEFDATFNNVSAPYLAVAERGRFVFHSRDAVLR